MDRGFPGWRLALALGVCSGCAVVVAAPAIKSLTPQQQAIIDACDALPEDRALACLAEAKAGLPLELQQLVELAADKQLNAAMDAWQQAKNEAVLVQARALAARGDARNLLVAAVLAKTAGAGQPDGAAAAAARHWFDAARRTRPTDPLVAWMEALDCNGLAANCDSQAALVRLLAVDGDNAATHWLALNAAQQAGDPVAARTHLRLAAHAPRLEMYNHTLLGLIDQARRAMPTPPLPPQLSEAFARVYGMDQFATADDITSGGLLGMWVAIAMPPLMDTAELCDPDRLRDANHGALRKDCIALLDRLADDRSTTVTTLFALSALSQLTAGQPRGDPWRQQLRKVYWLFEKASPVMAGLPGSHVSGSEYFGWMANEGELEAMRRVLLRNGIAPEPPAGWLPSTARHRALVTSGRVSD